MSSSVGWATEKWPSSTPRSSAQPVITLAARTGSRVRTRTRSPSSARSSHGQLGQVAERPAAGQREADLGRAHVAPAELVGPADGDDLAVAHDRHPVGQVLGLVHEVGGEEDRLAELAQRADRRPGLTAGGRVEAGRRLVEEDQLGLADQRQREVEPPALAAGQLLGPLVALLGQLDELDHLVDAAAAHVVAAVHLDQLGDGQVASARRTAAARCPTCSRSSRGPPAGSMPSTRASPPVAGPVALEDLDGRRLAGPVRAEQAEHLAARDLEADAAHRLDLAVGLAQVAHLDGESRWCVSMDRIMVAQRRSAHRRRA